MANNFFVYKNLKVGKSLIEKNTKEIIEDIYKKAEEHNCEILIPEDCMVGTDFEGNGKNKNLNEIEDNEIILDIGFNTIKNIQKKSMPLILFCGMDRQDILKMTTFQKEPCLLQKAFLRTL